jgi:hypothetical protein
LSAVKNINTRLPQTATVDGAVFTRPTGSNANAILVTVVGSVVPSRRTGASSSSYLFAVGDLNGFLTYTGSQYSVDLTSVTPNNANGVTARWSTDSDSFVACSGGKAATCTSMSAVAPSEYAIVVPQPATPTPTPTGPQTSVPTGTPAPTVIAPVTPSPGSSSGLSDQDKAILGGVLGGVGGAILIGVIIGCVVYRRKQSAAREPGNTEASDAVAQAQGQA